MTKLNYRLTTKFERLRFLRRLLGITRSEIEKKYKLPEVTLKKWETGNITLTDKGIKKCLDIYRKEGIDATLEWIQTGAGLTPTFQTNSNKVETVFDCFTKLYPGCIIYQVPDNSMFPVYKKGDVVIGLTYSGNNKDLHETDCIVKFKDNTMMLATVYVSCDEIKLLSYNTFSNNETSFALNEKIEVLAPILWRQIGIVKK